MFFILGKRALPEPLAGGPARPQGGRRHIPVSIQPHAVNILQQLSSNLQTFCSKLCSMSALSCGFLSVAVNMEHEIFKSSKSSNLYKAAVLKKVPTNRSACQGKSGRRS